MRRLILLAAAALLALPPAARGEGAAFVVRTPSAGVYERPNAAQPDLTLIKGQVVTVLQSRGDWFWIITDRGEEGWMRESTIAEIPAGEEEESRINEASPDDIPEAVIYEFVIGNNKGNIRRRPSVNAPIARTAREGEIFNIVVQDGKWFQLSAAGVVEGWAHESVGTKRESRNISLRILDLVEGKLAVTEQVKNEAPAFRRAGAYPSLFLRRPEEDLVVTELADGSKEVLVNISYALRDIEYRTVIDTSESFFLPEANRALFADLIISIFDASREVSRVRIHLWTAVLEADGSLFWRSLGEVSLGRAVAGRIPREGSFTSALWSALETDTIEKKVWKRSDSN